MRCPHAERHQASASKPGVAASAGEAEKAQRYGEAVRPLVYESYGRLGPAGINLLGDLWRLQRPTAIAAHMQSGAGEPNCSVFCSLRKLTPFCVREGPCRLPLANQLL